MSADKIRARDEREAQMAAWIDPARDKWLRANAVADRYGVHRTTIFRWVQSGGFPAPEQIGPNVVGWRLSALVAWDAKRAAA